MSKLVQNYLLQQAVGKGVYGQVFRAIHQKSKQVFAVKVIPKSSFRANPKLEQLAINEINILTSVKHENIVKFVETLKTPNNFYFVYQFCNEGTLESLLKRRRFLKQAQALTYFRQLIEAFKQLNKNSIMHRDLKPDNIFLSDGIVKLGDFGFCKMLDVNMAQTMLGSPIYMAPEILKEEIYTSKADIWSLGVVLFEMLFGYCPFESSSISELISKLKDTEVTIPHEINRVSEQTEILLRKMLVKDQFKRIQWADLFGFVIDAQGRIVGGCKKEYAIENLQRYFLPENMQNTASSVKTIPYTYSSSHSNGSGYSVENQAPKYGSLKEIQSAQKSSAQQKTHPQTSGFVIQEQSLPKSESLGHASSQTNLNGSCRMIKKNSNSEQSQFQLPPLEKLSLKHKAESMPIENGSRKKIEKQKFGQIHSKWLDAVKLVQDLALNTVDASSVQICIYILLKKLMERVEKQSQLYPQWTDVLIQERMSLKQALDEIQRSNRDVQKIFQEEKENRGDERHRKQLMRIWQNARNKFTLERAIRTTFDKPSKQISIQQILS